jgi:hypothetical protein
MKKGSTTFLLPAVIMDGGGASARCNPEQRPGRPQGVLWRWRGEWSVV